MASKTKAANAAAAIAANLPRTNFMISEFCAMKNISESQYRLLHKAGVGPQETNVGLRGKRISAEAADEWDAMISTQDAQDKLKKYLQQQRLRRKQKSLQQSA